MDNLTPGRKLILDLLAKSVAKIQADDKSDLRKVEDQQSNGKSKSSKKRKVDNLDFDDCKLKNLMMRKHETIEGEIEFDASKVNNMIKTEVVETVKKETKVRKDKSMRKQLTEIPIAQMKVKTEYTGIKVENLDLEEKKCLKVEIKSEDNDDLGISIEAKTNGKSYSKKSKCRKRTVGIHRRNYQPEEDQVLLDAIEQFGDKINYTQIAKDLQRVCRSVTNRVKRLKTGISPKGHRSFTIEEDMVILDAVLEHLNGQSLEILTLSQSEWNEIGVQIGRVGGSLRERWHTRLRAWILQHYAGTLNLDIRRPLANYLAENFDDMQSIDWSFVNTMSEFAGHTERSLRYLFYSVILNSHRLLRIHQREDITLEMVAEFVNKDYTPGKKVLGRILKRQQGIIDYFECYVKSKNIKNFL